MDAMITLHLRKHCRCGLAGEVRRSRDGYAAGFAIEWERHPGTGTLVPVQTGLTVDNVLDPALRCPLCAPDGQPR